MGHSLTPRENAMLKNLLAPLLLLSLALPPCGHCHGDEGERVFIVKDYRYQPAEGSGADLQVGRDFCGTRCNALSFNYLNVIEPGGWRMIKITDHSEITVDLGNPFLDGACVCIGDEYVVKIDDLNRVR